MSAVRWQRMPVLVLLCLGMAACTRPASNAGDDSPPPSPEAGEERAGAGSEPLPAARSGDESAAGPRYPAIAGGIGVGPEAVSSRRRALASSERALDSKVLGYFLDVHEARLLQSLGDSVQLRRENAAFHLQIGGRARFATGSAQPNSFLQRELQAIAEALAEFDRTLVVIHAHTDASGPTEYNQALSERRALRVSETLVDNGVDPRRVVAIGHGESEPIADNGTAGGRARNRRVEVVVEAILREPQG